MHRLLASFIKTTIITSLFFLASYANSQTLNWEDAILLIDEDGHAEIPSGYTAIGNGAFKNLNLLTIDLPDGLQTIDEAAFANSNITTIDLPNSLTYIGANAFLNSRINEIVIPDSVTTIGHSAFEQSDVELAIISESINSLPYDLFYNSNLKSVTLPSQLEVIGDKVFRGTPLEVIDLPESLSIIHNYAFQDTLLSEVVIPDAVSAIGVEAFRDAPIKKLTIGSGISSPLNVMAGAFFNVCLTLEQLRTSSPIGFRNDTNSGERAIYTDNRNLYVRPGINFPTYSDNSSNSCPNLKLVSFSNNIAIHRTYSMGSDNSYDTVLNFEGNEMVVTSYQNGQFSVFDIITITQPVTSFATNLFKVEALTHLCSDTDSDGDDVLDCVDAFPNDSFNWSDADGNGLPDYFGISSGVISLDDSDGDGLPNIFDSEGEFYPDHLNSGYNSRENYGENNLNTDGDSQSNWSDPDDDNDGLLDIYEPFFGTNPLIPDSDFDGVLDGLDAFPTDNTESLDTDTDGIGNNTDTDDDNDGYTDFLDAFPLDATEWADSDSDGIGNNGDLDDDNDGVADAEDAFPYTASESVDTDGDGIGDNADAFPSDSTEWADSDLDGIGNNADPDDDNDSVADTDDSEPLDDSIGDLPSQLVAVSGTPKGVNGHQLSVSLSYDASDDNNQLTGLGYRVHFDSNYLTYSGAENVLDRAIVVPGEGPYQDIANYDGDASTDSYVLFAWAAIMTDWPNVELPLSIGDVLFDVNFEADSEQAINTVVNFSEVDASLGYEFESTAYDLSLLPASWDFDGNGSADALTDGLMLLRYTFGIQDIRMTDNAVAADATLTPEQIVSAMNDAMIIADIDNNGDVSALTDGLMLLRYLFGLRNDALTNSAVDPEASRADATSIETYIDVYLPGR